MLSPIEAMKTALRMLTALTEKSQPDAADLQALRAFQHQSRDLPADELACEVIQEALRERAEVRAAK